MAGARRRTRPFLIECLETRLLMDADGGPTFVPNLPHPDPVETVPEAGISATNDYYETEFDWNATNRRLRVLSNDRSLSGAGSMRIIEVGPTQLGGVVTISGDGQYLQFTAARNLSGREAFYYVVEDDDGKRGRADVKIDVHRPMPPDRGPVRDEYEVLEDTRDVVLDVLRNDRRFSDGILVDVTESTFGSTIRMADDGKSLLYTPAAGSHGIDRFHYSVRGRDGQVESAAVAVQLQQRYVPHANSFGVDPDSDQVVLDVLSNDEPRQPAKPPRIVAVTSSHFGASIEIAPDGKSLLYRPAIGFQGSESFRYTVRYGPLDHHTTTTTLTVSVADPYLAVPDWRRMDPGSFGNVLDVLANDPILVYDNLSVARRELSVVDVGRGSARGEVAIAADGKTILYTPLAGFIGEETFTYTVADNTGHRDAAEVTILVAERPIDPFDLPRFIHASELEQFLIDEAVDRLKRRFGDHFRQYVRPEHASGEGAETPEYRALSGGLTLFASSTDYSSTNTQVDGIDEADVVETDGDFVYSLEGGSLKIVDTTDLDNPRFVSVTRLDDPLKEMYLYGDRLTLIARGRGSKGAVVVVLDVSDRSAPRLVGRTEIDGTITESRAAGEQLHLVISRRVTFPELERRPLDLAAGQPHDPTDAAHYEYWRYETVQEYVARLHESFAESSLPNYRSFGPDGLTVATGLLSEVTQIHKPLSQTDRDLVSLTTIDMTGTTAAPIASAGLFSAAGDQIYVSHGAAYVTRRESYWDVSEKRDRTTLLRFRFDDDRTSYLEAAGSVPGIVVNQFSMDEYNDALRIVTTETFRDIKGRIARQFNHLHVLQADETELIAVGRLENLSPAHHVESVRFLGDRAFVTTYADIDPLLAIDLSDPTAPRLRGYLDIPGFSDYLHPIGNDYLIGFGRTNDTSADGTLLPQVSLFDVRDLDHPQLIARLTMQGADRAWAEAFSDHHAVAYFPEHRILSVPMDWRAAGSGGAAHTARRGSSAFLFRIDVDQTTGAMEYLGRVDHPDRVRRTVRIDDTVLSISDTFVKVSQIDSPENRIAEVFMGEITVDDSFKIREDSRSIRLDVLANDYPDATGQTARIVAVDAPESIGTVHIVHNGKALRFKPAKDFAGWATFTYTVIDPVRGEQTATVRVQVQDVPDDPQANPDWFTVAGESRENVLDVLANDVSVDRGRSQLFSLEDVAQPAQFLSEPVASAETIHFDNSDFYCVCEITVPLLDILSLRIISVGEPDHGGTVSIDSGGAMLSYTPAAGFRGTETFTYTIRTPAGRTDRTTVAVFVGRLTPGHPLRPAGGNGNGHAAEIMSSRRSLPGQFPTAALPSSAARPVAARGSSPRRVGSVVQVQTNRSESRHARHSRTAPRPVPSPQLTDAALLDDVVGL